MIADTPSHRPVSSYIWMVVLAFFFGRTAARLVGRGLEAMDINILAAFATFQPVKQLMIASAWSSVISGVAMAALYEITRSRRQSPTLMVQLSLGYVIGTLPFIYILATGMADVRWTLAAIPVTFGLCFWMVRRHENQQQDQPMGMTDG